MIIDAAEFSKAMQPREKNGVGSGNSLAERIKRVMAEINRLGQYLKENAAGMSKEEQKLIQNQLLMLQQQLEQLLAQQAEEAQRKKQGADKPGTQPGRIDLFI